MYLDKWISTEEAVEPAESVDPSMDSLNSSIIAIFGSQPPNKTLPYNDDALINL
jgi:hypothetical protein